MPVNVNSARLIETIPAINKNIISPAYKFPYNRSANESGLAIRSIISINKFAGNIHGPNGCRDIDFINPTSPFDLMLKIKYKIKTDSASAAVRLRSVVGTTFK